MATVNFDVSDVLDITVRKGDTFTMTINLKDSAGNALQLDTQGYSFIMEVKLGSENSPGSSIISTTNASKSARYNFEPVVIDDSGNATITASPSVMSQIPHGTYVYDIQYIKPNSSGVDDHKTILKGTFTVNQDISVPA